MLRFLLTLMTFKGVATLVMGAGALSVAAWFAADWLVAAALGTGARESLPVVESAVPPEAAADALAAEIARLHERLRPDAPPRRPGRNLFQFSLTSAAARVPSRTPLGSAVHAPALTDPGMVTERAPRPPFKLIGIAEDPGPDGPVRAAIVSAPGQVFVVKVGETFAARYRAARIAADVAEFTDATDGTTFRLALK